MTEPTRKAIETLGRKLRNYHWELYAGSIRCSGIDSNENHADLELCPLAMAITHSGDRIRHLLEDPEHRKFAELVNNEQPHIRKHLEEEDPTAESETLDREAALYAAAAIVHEGPRRAEIALILDMDPAVVEHIAHAADHPNCETGRALVRALDSRSHWLREQYEAHYGELDAVLTPA